MGSEMCIRDRSITEKFIASLQIYLAAILDKFQNSEEVGDRLRTVNSMKDIQLKFILVVKNAEDITWLAGPLAELKARLLQIRKIWGVEIAVLNEELAGEYLSLIHISEPTRRTPISYAVFCLKKKKKKNKLT